jgi:hypothetical protein
MAPKRKPESSGSMSEKRTGVVDIQVLRLQSPLHLDGVGTLLENGVIDDKR